MGTIYIQVENNNEALTRYYNSWELHNEGDSGIDLPFPEELKISLCETRLVPLNIRAMALDASGDPIPLVLYPRSSIFKTPLMMVNSVGIIDSGYRGIIHAPMYYRLNKFDITFILACLSLSFININIFFSLMALIYINFKGYTCKKDKPLFQLCSPDLRPLKIEVVDKLPDSDRGESGFGSTNIKNE